MFSQYDAAQLTLLVSSIKTLEQLFSNEFGIQLYLTWGTLLGAIRQNDFINYDNDVDLAYLSKKELDFEILEEHEYIVAVLEEHNFSVRRNSKGQIHVRVMPETESGKGAAFNLDIWTTWARGGKYYHYPDIKGELESKEVLPLVPHTFHDESFLVPTGFGQVLSAFYGENWLKPDKNYAWYPRYNADDEFEFLRSSAVKTPVPIPKFPLKSEQLEIREQDEYFFVSGPSLAEEKRLNSSAIVILELCTGENTVEDIIQLIQKTFELPTAPEVAVLEFLTNAAKNGLLVNS
ncbi:MAG: hypothetical protein COA96_04490 [SAR86 cluster bacterium]|uniref:LicD/FKTN/FKRP nucleotidyltransferase domain-containing protein n=1 Tax=SAR86 cluster bacterium TaxID=2030880 RepID=A0A2A5B5X2_9GAMM|nr:MAG: hypothetical protein COA96_04490 [SAR86 cluster bacterium]